MQKAQCSPSLAALPAALSPPLAPAGSFERRSSVPIFLQSDGRRFKMLVEPVLSESNLVLNNGIEFSRDLLCELLSSLQGPKSFAQCQVLLHQLFEDLHQPLVLFMLLLRGLSDALEAVLLDI